ncbi:hypothetical protein NLI96_g9750 [Meripilus lineatus]|uniref:Carbohydrate esterase family 16 protein n=1 Tax=Meripilus lineatus TaxID=2056292 RepID=A0AAD5V039_9APHY|nr:hypothetical protein NLI96_g9750 [Physisporinus lineatus]
MHSEYQAPSNRSFIPPSSSGRPSNVLDRVVPRAPSRAANTGSNFGGHRTPVCTESEAEFWMMLYAHSHVFPNLIIYHFASHWKYLGGLLWVSPKHAPTPAGLGSYLLEPTSSRSSITSPLRYCKVNMAPTIGQTWNGFGQIKHLVIFGDSYSDVGYNHRSRHPTPTEPLGVDYPGNTFAEYGSPNWVGYLVKEFFPEQEILVYDFAVGGQLCSGVIHQIQTGFLPHAGQKPAWAPWTDSDTLFGEISFKHSSEPDEFKEYQGRLFEAQAELYDNGARNFMFIDVPPIDRSPAVPPRFSYLSGRYNRWNDALGDNISEFVEAHPDITAFTFSSHALFNRLLDNPTQYGFPEDETKKEDGAMWVDHLHPTTAVHKEIARAVSEFLTSQPAWNPDV